MSMGGKQQQQQQYDPDKPRLKFIINWFERSFNNEGDGKQDFRSSVISGGNRKLSYDEDDSGRRNQKFRDVNWYTSTKKGSYESNNNRNSLQEFSRKNVVGPANSWDQRLSYEDDSSDLWKWWNRRSNEPELTRRNGMSVDDPFYYGVGRDTRGLRHSPPPSPPHSLSLALLPPPRATTRHRSDVYEEESEYSNSDVDDEESYDWMKKYVHVYLEYLSLNASVTIVQGLKRDFDYSRILDQLIKQLHCQGQIVCHADYGKVIKLNGDHVRDVSNFLLNSGYVPKRKHIRISFVRPNQK